MRTLSSARLTGYKNQMPAGSSTHDVLAYYLWNMALCSALYASLNSLEIALRNNIQAAFSTRYRNERWFDSGRVGLTPKQEGDISQAKKNLFDRGYHDDSSKEYTGRLIAELNFTFWVILFNDVFEPRVWDGGGNLLGSVFRYRPPRPAKGSPPYSRRKISVSLNRILNLRNRAFHHEPVWKWKAPPINDLKAQYAEIIEILGLLDQPWIETMRCLEHMPFDQLFDRGHTPYLQHINAIIPVLYPFESDEDTGY